jgi:hypothetical protein
MSMMDDSRGWWSWRKAALGFGIPLVVYALLGTYVYVNYRRIEAAGADAPHGGAGWMLFIAVVYTVIALTALLIVLLGLCFPSRTRAFAVGMLIPVLLPLLVVVGFVVHLWLSIGAMDDPNAAPGLTYGSGRTPEYSTGRMPVRDVPADPVGTRV